MKHKVISLLQPWASLVVLGHKRIETRSWNTKYRGPLLIHASMGKQGKAYYESLPNHLAQYPFEQCLPTKAIEGPKYREVNWEALTFGAIIGSVTLVDTYKSELFFDPKAKLNQDWGIEVTAQELAFGDYSPGRYGWLLSDPVIFDTPIPAKGHPGIWEWEGEVAENSKIHAG